MKKIVSLALSALLVAFCLSPSAMAESYSISSFNCTFSGSKLYQNGGGSLRAELSRLEPGDSLTLAIPLQNNDTVSTDWYMQNKIIKSLEDSRNVKGGAYEYNLSYTDSLGNTTVFFDSSAVGGDNGSIKTATGNLNDYFFVDTLAPGKTGEVLLKVAVDGEADGNSYQNSMAELNISFAVEKAGSTTKNVYYGPKTGDSLNMTAWGVVFILSLAALTTVSMIMVHTRRREKE